MIKARPKAADTNPGKTPHFVTGGLIGRVSGRLGNQLTGYMSKVRFRADGMAYVFYPITHPDQDEPILIDKPQKVYLNFVTLLLENEQWRVHDVGPVMIPPQDLGRQPYSW